ncbi:MAG TPA: diacylglycerol kinase family protein [Cyclobacteriaceae bacterium]|jgi:YegS/Rv2252/BmrU family lipid kinase|nr:diacylglycerol kinase family protein [Cyclobacteriaceae bacterium]
MNENKKVFFIINKFSGTGYLPEVEGRIITRCGELNLECTIEFTKERGHGKDLAKEALQKNFDTVFAVGGDGTINEVAQGLINSNATMGIIPKGSGNGLARHLGIPLKLNQALNLLQYGRPIEMDTIRINGNLSLNVSGIGFDAHIAKLFQANEKRGLSTYAKLTLSEFWKYNEFASTAILDGNKIASDVFMLSIANSSQFGNDARIAPEASVCDGLMDICFLKKVPILSLAPFAQKMFSGRIHQSRFMNIVKAKKMDIHFATPVAYHIDGEAMKPESDFSVEICPASLKVLVPKNSTTQF